MKSKILVLGAIIAMMASCNSNKFKVEGNIEGATDTTQLVLEVSSNGNWLILDSISPDAKGHFSVSEEAPEYPNIYRLRVGGQSIYFPIDSLDKLTINTKLAQFGTQYTVAGSQHAEQVMKIDQEAMQMGNASEAEMKAWKHKLAEQIVADPSGIVAYYAINKYANNRPLFDPADDFDLRIVGAVANAFYTFKPQDPRTDFLVSVLTDGQKRRRMNSEATDTVYADVASLIDIKLQDYNGTTHDLKDVAAKHSTVLLNFTIYQADFSPVFNKMLNDLYSKYKGRGFEIYQVSVDPDNVAWSQAAKNLPWITVYEPLGINGQSVGAYQVTGAPTSFVIRNGEIVERVEDASKLEAALARHI